MSFLFTDSSLGLCSRFLLRSRYREARLKELRMKEEAAARVKILPQGHGEPVFIKRDEFIKHVTEAEHGTWVVVFLFQNG